MITGLPRKEAAPRDTWRHYLAGGSGLVNAPTGTGKTPNRSTATAALPILGIRRLCID